MQCYNKTGQFGNLKNIYVHKVPWNKHSRSPGLSYSGIYFLSQCKVGEEKCAIPKAH